MRFLFILLTFSTLAGCTDILSANQESISISHDAFTVKDAFKTATDHCSKFGKNAVHTNGLNADGLIITTWECR